MVAPSVVVVRVVLPPETDAAGAAQTEPAAQAGRYAVTPRRQDKGVVNHNEIPTGRRTGWGDPYAP